MYLYLYFFTNLCLQTKYILAIYPLFNWTVSSVLCINISICSVFSHVFLFVFVCVLFTHLYLQKLFTFLPPLLCLTELSAPCFAENTSELRSASLTFLFPHTPPLLAQFTFNLSKLLNVYFIQISTCFCSDCKMFLSKFQYVSVSITFLLPHKPLLLGVRQNIAPLFTQFTLIILNHLHSSNLL